MDDRLILARRGLIRCGRDHRYWLWPICGLFISLLSACHGDRGSRPPTFSPNGEPLVGSAWPDKCEDALGAWFDRIDTSHSDEITLAQLEADALRQYQVMDLRHDGKVTAEELSKYRLATMGGHYLSVSTPDQKNVLARRDSDDERTNDLDRAFGDPERRRHGDDSPREIDAFSALVTDQPDPVMSADTDLDGSVTWDEFRALVAQNFADLDRAHKGAITKEEVQTRCARGR